MNHIIVEQKEPTTRFIIDRNTALAQYLKNDIREAIEKTIHLYDGEMLEIIYIYDGTFDHNFNIARDIIVGISNYRIFKIEDGKCNSRRLDEMTHVEHQKNGLFKWDKIVCYLSKYKRESANQQEIDTFGIYHSDVCKYYCNYINEKIKKRREIV